MREPDAIGTAGNAWHLKRQELPDRDGNLAQSVLVIPGCNPQGSWLIAVVRQFRAKRRFMPTKKTYPLAELELIVAVLATQPLDMEVPLSNYPRLNPIVFSVQFDGISSSKALEVYDAVMRLLISGSMQPRFSYHREWQMMLGTMIDQIKADEGNLEITPQLTTC